MNPEHKRKVISPGERYFKVSGNSIMLYQYFDDDTGEVIVIHDKYTENEKLQEAQFKKDLIP